MFLKSQILPGLIGFLLLNLQNFRPSCTLNMIEFPEINYLASKLTPDECFQLYKMSQGRYLKDEKLNYIQKKSHAIPCVTLLSTWLTNPNDVDYKTFDNVTMILTKIGRNDLAVQLDRSSDYRRNKTDFIGAKESENEIINKSRDERSQEFICPKPPEKMKIFWEIFFIVLTILIVLFLCLCCCCCIYEKLRCTCSRNELNYCGNEKNEDEYCLCTEKLRETSYEDYCTNKNEPSSFKKIFLNFKQYFRNREEQKKEKLRYERFQKLKRKLQKMNFEKRKEIRVNRQEERILNSLTEKERDELGETICEMRFFLDSDKETEKLLLSGKHSGTFIIDMKNLHKPKITHSNLSNHEIETIKKWESKERFSTSLSERMTVCVSQPKSSSESEISRNDREKKKHRKSNSRRKESEKYLKQKRKNSKHVQLEESSEFIKCCTMSESEQCCSSPIAKQSQRCLCGLELNSNFSTSEGSEISTCYSENKCQNPSPTQVMNKIRSDTDKHKKNSINVIKSKSMIEFESMKVNQIFQLSTQNEKQETNYNNQNKGDYLNNEKSYKLMKKNNNSSKSINSCWSITACQNKRNLEKSNENLTLFKNLDHGDTESQVTFQKTCDEFCLLVSQQMKQQPFPYRRKYCLLRRHLKQRTHDLKQCQIKKNYFQFYPNGEAPSCRTGQICSDTYDEFKLMRASPRERKKLRQSIYERRKKFLHQPCISPRRKCF